MEVNMDQFKKWCEKSGLFNIELTIQQPSADAIPEGTLTISGYTEDITKCLVILMYNWDKDKKKSTARKGR